MPALELREFKKKKEIRERKKKVGIKNAPR